MARERGIDRYYRQVREIRDELEVSHEAARELWSDYYAPGGMPIKPVKKLPPPKPKPTVRIVATNKGSCPFCRDDVTADGSYACSSCQTRYHLDCFQQELGGRCTTLGCKQRATTTARFPTAPQPAPTFYVHQTGREPIPVRNEQDAYRMAAHIIEPGRAVHVTQTPTPPPVEEPHATLTQPEEPYQARFRVGRSATPPRDRSFSGFMHHMFGPLGMPVLIVAFALLTVLLLAFLT